MSDKQQYHQIEIDHGMIALIKSITKQTSTEIVCQLFELVEDCYKRVCSNKSHWTSKKVTYPNTPLVLNAKTRFAHSGKWGAATSTFVLHARKPICFTAQQVHDLMVETILLGYKGELDE